MGDSGFRSGHPSKMKMNLNRFTHLAFDCIFTMCFGSRCDEQDKSLTDASYLFRDSSESSRNGSETIQGPS